MLQKPTNMRGRLYNDSFLNHTKRGPSYSGICTIDGKTYRIVGWRNPANPKTGTETIGLQFEAEDHYQERIRAYREDALREVHELLQEARGAGSED